MSLYILLVFIVMRVMFFYFLVFLDVLKIDMPLLIDRVKAIKIFLMI